MCWMSRSPKPQLRRNDGGGKVTQPSRRLSLRMNAHYFPQCEESRTALVRHTSIRLKQPPLRETRSDRLNRLRFTVRVMFGFLRKAVQMSRQTGIKLFLCPVAAGYPSPAQDYTDGPIDLNEHLITNPPATFFVRASGESMRDAGILDGDLLVVDRSINPRDGHVVVAVVDGDFTVKCLCSRNDRIRLIPANDAYQPVEARSECMIWGVVTYSIHTMPR